MLIAHFSASSACLSKLGHADHRVSFFFVNKCRRVRLAKRRDRRGRSRTCFLEYPSVQEGLSRACLLAATLPTVSTISASGKMGDEITLLVFEVSTIRTSSVLASVSYTTISLSNLMSSSVVEFLPIISYPRVRMRNGGLCYFVQAPRMYIVDYFILCTYKNEI